MFLFYDFIFLLYALVYLPYLLLTRRWYTGFEMRLGFFTPFFKEQISRKANIWVHAVSVGEVMVIEGFIDQLKKNYPSYQLVVTVTTKTGYTLACQRLKEKALVIPSPIDFSFVVGYFVSLIKPKVYIAVETEIWPNLFRKLYVKKIPLLVVNGRISDNSFGRYKAIRFLLKSVLNQVSLWCMQSQRDARRIMELGAESSHVIVTGNLKFDALPSAGVDPSFRNVVDRKDLFWWVAGSTHPGEEEIVLDVYKQIVKENPQWRLVIAPRHVERTAQIIDLITQKGLTAVKFSELTQLSKRNERDSFIIVVDTIGHLRSLYSIASLVFVGKSLSVGGGHNIIEPAFYGKAIVIGPKCENFMDIVASFKERNAVVQVEDVFSFETAIKELVADPLRREILGAAAKEVIAVNQGATQRSLDYLAEFLK